MYGNSLYFRKMNEEHFLSENRFFMASKEVLRFYPRELLPYDFDIWIKDAKIHWLTLRHSVGRETEHFDAKIYMNDRLALYRAQFLVEQWEAQEIQAQASMIFRGYNHLNRTWLACTHAMYGEEKMEMSQIEVEMFCAAVTFGLLTDTQKILLDGHFQMCHDTRNWANPDEWHVNPILTLSEGF